MELYRSSVRSSTEALYGVLLKLYTELYRSLTLISTDALYSSLPSLSFELCRRLPFVSAVASLSSLPSPPFRLCRRLPFVSAVASLCSSAVVAGAPPVIYPLKTRHRDTTNDSTTTSLPQSRRPPLQPVCHRADLHYNQSATEQTTPNTTSLQPSCCRRPLPQLVY